MSLPIYIWITTQILVLITYGQNTHANVWALSRVNLSLEFLTKPDIKPVSAAADLLDNRNLSCSKFRYDAFRKANNKGADQTARMPRLVCTFDVCKPPKIGFLTSRSISDGAKGLIWV